MLEKRGMVSMRKKSRNKSYIWKIYRVVSQDRSKGLSDK